MAIENLLKSFDTLTRKGFDENDISTVIKLYQSQSNDEVNEKIKAELMAFTFCEDYKDDGTGWGTYFGPMMVMGNEDGSIIEIPSIKLVTDAIIEYWHNRSKESTNPILKARYSGLVWDFKKAVTGSSAPPEVCRLNINSIIDIANGEYHKYPTSTFSKLRRALTLAIGFNDRELIVKVKNAIIEFEDKYSNGEKPGLWGYSFDLLLQNKRVNLSITEEEKIIKGLESKLTQLSNSDTENEKIDPWAAERAAKRLATYYRFKQMHNDAKRVILEVGNAYNKIIGDASALQASGWLEHLHKLYISFNLTSEAEPLLLRIRELGPKVASELKPITQSFELPKEKLENYVNSMTEGTPEEVLIKIAIQYIPIKEKVKEQIFDLSKKSPISYNFHQKIQDEKGRVVATIGPLENDLEGHVVRQVSQNLAFSALFLRSVIYESLNRKKINKSDIQSFIYQSPVIHQDRKSIIDRALDAYFESDHLIFIHLIIPQIEESVRNIVEYAGGNVLKSSRGGGFHLRTFDEILRDSIIIEALGDDMADYFKMLFTDQRGWNVRNSVCHGMASTNNFNQQVSDRILHSLICLGLVREEKG